MLLWTLCRFFCGHMLSFYWNFLSLGNASSDDIPLFYFLLLLFSHCQVQLFMIPWTAVCQASLSFSISQSLLELMSTESVMPSNHLILCCSLLLLPSIFPSTRVFSRESALCIRWPKYWSFSFSISPYNEYSELVSFTLTGLISLLSKGLSRVFPSTTIQKYPFFSAQPSLWSNSHIYTWLLEKP